MLITQVLVIELKLTVMRFRCISGKYIFRAKKKKKHGKGFREN